jgi:hypothetical protein
MAHRRKDMPERQDYEQIERKYGPLPPNASEEEMAYRYNLAVAAGIIREWKQLENKKMSKQKQSAAERNAALEKAARKRAE